MDRIAASVVGIALLRKEPDLFESKWFDYRHLHPLLATQKFMHEYRAAHREAMQARVGMDDAIRAHGTKNMLLTDAGKREFTSFWKARQKADELGMPYGFFCRTAMTTSARWGWPYTPRPMQLYSDEMVERTKDAWAEFALNNAPLATHPTYLASDFASAPDQIAYQRWLAKHIQLRRHPEFLARTLLDKGHLHRVTAEQFVGPDIVRKALSLDLQ